LLFEELNIEVGYQGPKLMKTTSFLALFSLTLLWADRTTAATFTGLGDVDGGPFFSVARAVSGDGSTVVGIGTNPDGNSEAWIAQLGSSVPEPTSLALAAMAGAGLLSAGRRRSSPSSS
jgi:hypothetical protein